MRAIRDFFWRVACRVCVCLGRMRMSACAACEDDDAEEGGAVGAPLYPIANHSRTERRLERTCRGFGSPGLLGCGCAFVIRG